MMPVTMGFAFFDGIAEDEQRRNTGVLHFVQGDGEKPFWLMAKDDSEWLWR
jgi:hypothetical protein